MPAPRPDLSAFVASMTAVDSAAEPRSFDRMMFDVCGEANHVRAAKEAGEGSLEDSLRSFERSCERIYADPAVTPQRKFSLRTAEWVLKSWCLWDCADVSSCAATRWFDAWQRERNMSLLQL